MVLVLAAKRARALRTSVQAWARLQIIGSLDASAPKKSESIANLRESIVIAGMYHHHHMFRYLVLLCASSTAITAQECNGDRDPSECSSLLDESSCGNYSLSLLCSRLSQSFVLFFFFLFLFHANRCASPRHECYHRTRAWLLFRQGCSWKGCGQTVPCDVQHLPFTSQLHSSLKSRYNLVIKTIHHHQYYPGAWETRTVA